MCYSTTYSAEELSHGTVLKKKKKVKIHLKVCAFSESATIGLCFSALKVHCYFRLCFRFEKKIEDDIKPNGK